MSNRSSLELSTRSVKIYSGAADAQARADIAEHEADLANPHAVTAAQVGLGNADNTSDANKPVSGPQAAALALKAPLISPALSGVPTAPTAALGSVGDQVATLSFVQAAITAVDVPAVSDELAAHIADTANPHQVEAADVGLGAVDNTADASKPVSAPQQTAINAAAAIGTAAQADIDGHQLNVSNPHSTTKAQVGLGAVDNTSDLAKPVSTAQQTAINVAAAAAAAAQADIEAHATNTSNPHSVDAADVGLGNVDNTADLDKPVSTATQAAINAAAADAGTIADDLAAHVADTDNPHAVSAADVGLGNVANLAPADLPVSTATQLALNLKAPIASPALTGTPTAPTAAPLTNSTQLATTAYADAAASAVAASAEDAGDAAAAAQEDATQAIDDAAAAQAAADLALDTVRADNAHRPGDAVALYGTATTGEPATVPPVDPAWVATSAAGKVLRVTAETAADPQIITTIAAPAIEAGFTYDLCYKVQRLVNPVDPLNDSVTLGIAWLNNAKAQISVTTIDDLPLVVADGVQQRSARIGRELTAPANTVYCRPFVQLFGNAHTTDVIVVELVRVCPDDPPITVTVPGTLPVGGAGLVLVEPTAPITVTMPPTPTKGQTLIIKDAIGAAGTYPITINGGGVNIEGVPTLVLGFAYQWARLAYSGSQWLQI